MMLLTVSGSNLMLFRLVNLKTPGESYDYIAYIFAYKTLKNENIIPLYKSHIF